MFTSLSYAVGWVIVGAFAITFVVTIAALIGVVGIQPQYLSRLFTKLILEIIAAGLFLFYNMLGHSGLPPYGGEWKGTIYWYESYAQTLFNYRDADPEFKPVNPRSEGNLYFYRSTSGVYEGFSTWETKNGEQTYSKLVVLQSNFKFDDSGRLESVCVKTAFRTALIKFSYGPFTRYRMQFTNVSESHMQGKMIVYIEGQEVEVGDVVLERK
jgi:hypothetical protein